MPFWTVGRGDVVGLDDDERGQRAAGERGLDAVVGLHDRQVVRQARGARVDRVHVQRGEREHDQDAAGGDDARRTGRASARSMTQPHTRDSPWLRWRRRPMIRHAALLDVVAELGEHGGEDGDAAEHRDGDDEHRADGEAR